MYNKLKAIRSLYVRQLYIICQYSYIQDSGLLNSLSTAVGRYELKLNHIIVGIKLSSLHKCCGKTGYGCSRLLVNYFSSKGVTVFSLKPDVYQSFNIYLLSYLFYFLNRTLPGKHDTAHYLFHHLECCDVPDRTHNRFSFDF